MLRKLWIPMSLVVAAALLATGASASQGRAWPYPIGLSIPGSHTVTPGVPIKRYVLVKNNTTHVFRRLKLMFTSADLIVKSRKRFKVITLQVYAPRTTAR